MEGRRCCLIARNGDRRIFVIFFLISALRARGHITLFIRDSLCIMYNMLLKMLENLLRINIL